MASGGSLTMLREVLEKMNGWIAGAEEIKAHNKPYFHSAASDEHFLFDDPTLVEINFFLRDKRHLLENPEIKAKVEKIKSLMAPVSPDRSSGGKASFRCKICNPALRTLTSTHQSCEQNLHDELFPDSEDLSDTQALMNIYEHHEDPATLADIWHNENFTMNTDTDCWFNSVRLQEEDVLWSSTNECECNLFTCSSCRANGSKKFSNLAQLPTEQNSLPDTALLQVLVNRTLRSRSEDSRSRTASWCKEQRAVLSSALCSKNIPPHAGVESRSDKKSSKEVEDDTPSHSEVSSIADVDDMEEVLGHPIIFTDLTPHEVALLKNFESSMPDEANELGAALRHEQAEESFCTKRKMNVNDPEKITAPIKDKLGIATSPATSGYFTDTPPLSPSSSTSSASRLKSDIKVENALVAGANGYNKNIEPFNLGLAVQVALAPQLKVELKTEEPTIQPQVIKPNFMVKLKFGDPTTNCEDKITTNCEVKMRNVYDDHSYSTLSNQSYVPKHEIVELSSTEIPTNRSSKRKLSLMDPQEGSERAAKSRTRVVSRVAARDAITQSSGANYLVGSTAAVGRGRKALKTGVSSVVMSTEKKNLRIKKIEVFDSKRLPLPTPTPASPSLPIGERTENGCLVHRPSTHFPLPNTLSNSITTYHAPPHNSNTISVPSVTSQLYPGLGCLTGATINTDPVSPLPLAPHNSNIRTFNDSALYSISKPAGKPRSGANPLNSLPSNYFIRGNDPANNNIVNSLYRNENSICGSLTNASSAKKRGRKPKQDPVVPNNIPAMAVPVAGPSVPGLPLTIYPVPVSAAAKGNAEIPAPVRRRKQSNLDPVKRELHNQSERERRKQLRLAFDGVRQILLQNDPPKTKLPKVKVLIFSHRAHDDRVAYCKSLLAVSNRINKALVIEESLSTRQQRRLAKLRKKLAKVRRQRREALREQRKMKAEKNDGSLDIKGRKAHGAPRPSAGRKVMPSVDVLNASRTY
ncbi:uncharacterized protein LOC108671700 isoform X2 [Hyalella azteca]|nr:uncharacterized protein LOC108671700 isoform X2 [Hyalella azteca]